jgi:hypothetical protein
MTSAQVLALFAVAGVCALIAGLIGKRNGREGQGILLGFFPGQDRQHGLHVPHRGEDSGCAEAV